MEQLGQQYKNLIENMPIGFAHHKVIYDNNNKPVDYIFLEANQTFEKIIGLKRKEIIKQKVSDVLDNITEATFKWDQFYKDIALTVQGESIDEYFESRGRWYKVQVYSQEKNRFSAIFHDITKIKGKEQKLNKQSKRINKIMGNINDIVWSSSWPDLKVQFVSKTVKDIIGYTPEEVKEDQRFLHKITHPADKHLTKKTIQQLKEKGHAERESRIICKDGSIKWFQDRSQLVYDDNNNPIRVESVMRDITERKKKEQKLKKQSKRLNNILGNIKDIVWSISWPDLEVQFISKAVEDIVGYTVEEFKRKHRLIQKITHPEDKAVNERAIKKLKEQGSVEREFRVICKDGDVIWIQDKSELVYDENNKPIRAEGVMREITEKKEAEEKIRYSRKRYQTIFDFAPLGIIIENENGDILEVNEEMSEMSGYSKEELENSNIIDKFVLPKYEELAKKNIKRIINGENLEYDIETPKKSGEMKYYHLKETNIELPSGNKGIISMHMDVTERKKQEDKLRNQRKRMENTIDATEAGTFEWNVQTGETIFNEKWAEMIGYTLDEISPATVETWKKFTHPDDLNKCEELLEKHFQGEIDQYKAEIRMKHKQGHWIWVLAQGKVISWTEDGKPLKMFGTHLNITERKKRIKELKSQHDFQKMLADISSKLVGISNANLDYEINNSLKEIGQFFEIDRSYIFQLSEDKKYVTNTHEWTAKGIESEKENLQNISVERLTWIMEKLYKQEVINVFDVEKLGEEAKSERDLFLEENIKSIVIMPIFIKDELWGFFGFDSVKVKKHLNQEKIDKIIIITDVITSAFLQYLNTQRIEKLTYKDSLTGLYNRRFFEEEMERLDTKRQLPISIVMGDINGLKIINDSYGHKKGDEVLVKTAEILKSSLREEDILARWAGDEFIILLPHTPKNKAQEIVSRIKRKNENISKEDIPISIGMGVATKINTEETLEVVLEKADDNMYKNKLSESRSASNKIVQNLLNTLGAKSTETMDHAMRMSKLAHDLGEKLNLSNSELNRLSLIATLHDIGKTTISEDILTKAGKLTKEEWEIMKEHPERGYKIASASKEFAVVAEEILYHHEHWDGSGYPKGSQKKEIPRLARIISIVDAYDVMTNHRPYTEAISEEEALAEIERCAGTQFDPILAKEFIELKKNNE